MPFPVLGSNSAVAGYEIDNSLRLNSSDSAYFKKTIGSGNRRTWTLSMWVKKTKIIDNTEMYLWSSDDTGSGNAHDGAGFYSFGSVTGDNTSNSFMHGVGDGAGRIIASAYARDVSAWYHIVWQMDTTNGTASDRMKMYVNGSRITDLVTSQTNVSQNYDTEFNRSGTENYLFSDHHYGRYYFDGYVADVAFVDGTALDASYFGETNNNGVWIPKTPDVSSWGTTGFFLEFKNSGSLGTDTSGNGNNWTPVNLTATDVTTDSPTNNWCTINPLANYYAAATYSEGNCKVVTDGTSASYATSTMGVANGKWYAEFKASAKSGGADWFTVGIAEAEGTANNLTLGRDTGHTSSANNGQIGYLGYATNFVYQNDAFYATSYSTDAYGVGDIIGVALNADDNEVTFYKNGTAQNSGTAFTIGASPKGFWHFAVGDFENQNYTWECNFGNAPFTISSGNSDSAGLGNFEYAVPSGYYSLCTKNLAEFG
jgi:hypothetical protein